MAEKWRELRTCGYPRSAMEMIMIAAIIAAMVTTGAIIVGIMGDDHGRNDENFPLAVTEELQRLGHDDSCLYVHFDIY